MKHLILLVLGFVPWFLVGQGEEVDSTIINHADSLLDDIYKSYNSPDTNMDYLQEKIKEASQFTLKNLGKNSYLYGRAALYYGFILNRKTDYIAAEKKILESKLAWEKTLDQDDPKIYFLYNILANNYIQLAKYEKAEALHWGIINFRKKKVGPEHQEYLGSIINLGVLYSDMYRLEKAEELFLEAKNTFENKLKNTTHPFYFNCLSNLAGVYYKQADYHKAETILLLNMGIIKDLFGREHPNYQLFRKNIAGIYEAMGQYEKAISYFTESKNFIEKSIGKKSEAYANVLYNLATLNNNLGNFRKSEKLLLEGIDILKETTGTETYKYPDYLSNLALIYGKLGYKEKEEELNQKATSIYLELYNKDHFNYLRTLINQASSYLTYGEFEKARPLFEEAVNSFEYKKHTHHPYYYRCLTGLASLEIKVGDMERAESLLEKLFTTNYHRLLKYSLHLSESELNDYISKFNGQQDLSLYLSKSTNSVKATTLSYNNALFYKGFLLNTANKIRFLAHRDTTARELLNLQKAYNRMLAAEYIKPLAERNIKLILQTEEKSNRLEKELIQKVTGYENVLQQVEWEDIQRRLHKEEVALEFVHFQNQVDDETKDLTYGAILLKENKSPLFISLFEQNKLNEILKHQNTDKTITVNNIYKNNSLYNLIWQPLEKELTGINTIYYSPSGLLHRINLNAIKTNENTTTGDQFKLVQLNSTRQLVIPSTIENKTSNALLFGGINYGMDSTEIAAVDYENDLNKITTRGSLDFSQSDSTHRGGSWEYLDWTEIETAAIESILKENDFNTTLWNGYKASEEAFKSIATPSPRILHIATHGFFFPDPEKTVDGGRQTVDGEPVFKISEHPMIRSGLIMAGGNHAWQTGKPFKPNMEDGVLTAYEISQMDLSNTELVVLSACETGLGDIEGNEGVYGLQRAFKIAGAKYLIMSLWQVPDYQTQELMKAFYKKWLNDEMDIPDAFRAAQQMMKKKYNDPFLWAGFVLVE